MDIISTRQVAELLAVSEATVKRWADAGTLRCFRTPGGHRKFRMEDVADFLRDYQYDSAGPLGSADPPPTAPANVTSIAPADRIAPNPPATIDPETVVQCRNGALSGDVDGLVSQIAQNRLRGLTLATIFDSIVTPALYDVGERWARGVLTVSQEHIAATTVIEALARTRPLIERTARNKGKIVFACPGEEQHDIAIRMAALLAHGLGFDTMLVGGRAPVADLALMITGERPRVVVVSASASTDPRIAAQELTPIVEAARNVGARIIAGGQGYQSISPPPANVTVVSSLADLVRALQGAADGASTPRA